MLEKIKALCRLAAETDENVYAYPADGFDANVVEVFEEGCGDTDA